MRAGSPETGQADPFAPRSPEVQVGRDVIPPKDERAGIVTTSEGPGGWGECSGEVNPRRVSTAGFLRDSGDCTDSSREQGPAGGRFRSVPPRGGCSAGNVRRARAPRGAPLAHEGNTLKGQAHGRSGASRAGRTGGGRREGGSQTPHAARGGEGIRRLRADPPVRDCVVGHQSPGEAASRDRHSRRFFGCDGRRRVAGLQGHVCEGERKRMEG
jgi:hypothetical protein